LRLNASMSLTVHASHLSIEYPSYPPLFLIGLIEIKSALVKRYKLKFRDQDSGRAYHTRLPSPHRKTSAFGRKDRCAQNRDFIRRSAAL
jgi:hypothetical protein